MSNIKDVHCKPLSSYKLEYMLVLRLAALPYTKQLFTEVEVNSGGYLPSYEAAR